MHGKETFVAIHNSNLLHMNKFKGIYINNIFVMIIIINNLSEFIMHYSIIFSVLRLICITYFVLFC